MAYASRAGRARTNPRSPESHAICDRCGARVNHVDLSWQFDWAGSSLINKRILVCDPCMDTPQQQLRTIVLPADPPVIMNARPEYFIAASVDYRTTQGNTVNAKTGIPVPGGDTRATEDDKLRTTQQTGFANGSLNEEPGTDPAAQTAPLATQADLPYDNTTVPETGPI